MKIRFLLVFLASFSLTHAQPADPNHEAQLKWFDAARFGMFIHWGVYAVPAGEWQGKPVAGIGEWIMKNGKIPVAAYKAFAPQFTAAKYDPVSWAKLAKTAGMKYVVITSKHHDGFALYDSAVTEWDVMNSGAKRDLLTPLAETVRAEGLQFGLYYSQAQDWTHPGGGKPEQKNWDPAQQGDYDQYLKTIALPQVKEIVTKFQPAILWWDTPMGITPQRAQPFIDYMAQHPAILNNNRLGGGFKGDTKTPEQHIPPRGYPGERFEVCMTMNDTWGFKKNDQNWKPLRQILRNLSDISSKGGNFLLNVGPTAEGEIPPQSIEILQGVGQWMKVNSEAIYGTTASPFPRSLPWGRVTQKASASGTSLFVHIWEWPSDRQLLLPTVKEVPTQGKLLANGTAIPAKSTPEGLLLQLPETAPDADVSVLRLDFPGPVTVTMDPFLKPDKNGRVSFSAQDADAHGWYDGNIQLRGSGTDTYLTDWKNPKWHVEYQFQAPQAQKWLVTAEVAATNPVKISLEANNVSKPAKVAATGPGLTWKTVPLGIIELPAGQTHFKLKAIPSGWKGLSLRNLWLGAVTSETPDPSSLRANDLGVLQLAAEDAELTGQLQLESGYLGYWTNPNDTVTWRVAGMKSGTYRVSLDYACQDDSAGSEFEVKIGAQTIPGKVTGTGSWTAFKNEVLGSVNLEKSDVITITVKATKKPGLAVMNLRSLTLRPKDLEK